MTKERVFLKNCSVFFYHFPKYQFEISYEHTLIQMWEGKYCETENFE